MTKTISLEEAKKLATPGKLFVAPNHSNYGQDISVGHRYPTGAIKWVGRVYDGGGIRGPSSDAKANAALLAHSWNIRDDLIEALEDMVEKHTTPQEPNAATRSADRAKAVLARAKEVEMP